MKIRAITGFFFIIVMLASVLLDHYVFGVFYLLLSGFALWEFYGLVKTAGIKPDVTTGILNGICIYAVFALVSYDSSYHKLLFLLPLTLSAVFIQELFKKSSAPFTNIGYTYLGLLFTIVPFTFFHALAYVGGAFNFHFPLGFLLMLWANDTGAYLVGSKLGRTKLFERHSPKKTWEGLIGGILITAVAAYFISTYFTEIALEHWIWMGILISCFGTTGDLIESMFKRSIDVKDSGGILPGHGGLLDRFDGLLIAAPIVYAYLYFIVNS
ncbi:phosphatidate cytidylyltransferase [Mucilaginibacter sp. UR6-11]|uniref:phosphatidate cytidylyltransferase n=1 Tax=Mucilaginibacter sp. UR6-11 TaxID=1435644 RepID=UPI001E5B6DE8|nr:phosphatidate cytidylyltransferase [Mucilaginibacter sp. UR6-11]MCC8424412.1 phosphatidate cytidylyltransferase [Mucilaginibacter sp. UR6-11]